MAGSDGAIADGEVSEEPRPPRPFPPDDADPACTDAPRARRARLSPGADALALAVTCLSSPAAAFGFGPGFPRGFAAGVEPGLDFVTGVDLAAAALRGVAVTVVDFAAAGFDPTEGRVVFGCFVAVARAVEPRAAEVPVVREIVFRVGAFADALAVGEAVRFGVLATFVARAPVAARGDVARVVALAPARFDGVAAREAFFATGADAVFRPAAAVVLRAAAAAGFARVAVAVAVAADFLVAAGAAGFAAVFRAAGFVSVVAARPPLRVDADFRPAVPMAMDFSRFGALLLPSLFIGSTFSFRTPEAGSPDAISFNQARLLAPAVRWSLQTISARIGKPARLPQSTMSSIAVNEKQSFRQSSSTGVALTHGIRRAPGAHDTRWIVLTPRPAHPAAHRLR